MIDLTLFTDMTLFFLCELIINSNFANAEPGHFEMQKIPPKENLLKKRSVLHRIGTWDHKNYFFEF